MSDQPIFLHFDEGAPVFTEFNPYGLGPLDELGHVVKGCEFECGILTVHLLNGTTLRKVSPVSFLDAGKVIAATNRCVTPEFLAWMKV